MHDEEQEGGDHLVDEGGADAVLAEIAWAPAVLAEPAIPAGRLAGENEVENHCAGNGAKNLRDHIGDEVLRRHAAGDEHAEADRGIDVAARNLADAIGHGDDGEAEGRGDAEKVDRGRPASHVADDGGAAADQHQRKCPNEFRDCLFHVHGDLPP